MKLKDPPTRLLRQEELEDEMNLAEEWMTDNPSQTFIPVNRALMRRLIATIRSAT